MRRLKRCSDLPGGIDENLRIRIGRSTSHITAVREQIGRSPQKAYLARCHLLFEQIGDRIEIADGLGERAAFRNDVRATAGGVVFFGLLAVFPAVVRDVSPKLLVKANAPSAILAQPDSTSSSNFALPPPSTM